MTASLFMATMDARAVFESGGRKIAIRLDGRWFHVTEVGNSLVMDGFIERDVPGDAIEQVEPTVVHVIADIDTPFHVIDERTGAVIIGAAPEVQSESARRGEAVRTWNRMRAAGGVAHIDPSEVTYDDEGPDGVRIDAWAGFPIPGGWSCNPPWPRTRAQRDETDAAERRWTDAYHRDLVAKHGVVPNFKPFKKP